MPTNEISRALDALSARFTAAPDAARIKGTPAVARITEGLVCEARGPSGEYIKTDMPPSMGGSGTAPNPGWLLRASMASCTAIMIASRAARLGVPLSFLEVSVNGDSDLRGMLGLDPDVSAGQSNLTMKVRVASADATPQALEEIVRWAEGHSPVGCTVCSGCSTELQVEVLPGGTA